MADFPFDMFKFTVDLGLIILHLYFVFVDDFDRDQSLLVFFQTALLAGRVRPLPQHTAKDDVFSLAYI